MIRVVESDGVQLQVEESSFHSIRLGVKQHHDGPYKIEHKLLPAHAKSESVLTVHYYSIASIALAISHTSP